jgi:hypothetical protein
LEIQEEIDSGNACYRSTQNLLTSPLFKYVKNSIRKTLILPVILYGCENSSLTVREERRLRVFEDRVLRRIFGPKRDEVTGGWRKLHNEELHNLPLVITVNISKSVKWAGHVARMWEGWNT